MQRSRKPPQRFTPSDYPSSSDSEGEYIGETEEEESEEECDCDEQCKCECICHFIASDDEEAEEALQIVRSMIAVTRKPRDNSH